MHSTSTAGFAAPLKNLPNIVADVKRCWRFPHVGGVNLSTDSCCVLWRFPPLFAQSSDQLTVPQLVREFPTFCGIRSFFTVSTRDRHLPICYSKAVLGTACHVIGSWPLFWVSVMAVLPVLPYTVLNVIPLFSLHPVVHNFCNRYCTIKR
jgi:hypothetical protein